MLKNIRKNVANLSRTINTRNVAKASRGLALFSYFAIATYGLQANVNIYHFLEEV